VSKQDDQQRRIVELIEQGIVEKDELCAKTGLSPGTVGIYASKGWRRLRPGVPKPRLVGSLNDEERAEQNIQALEERLRTPPTEEQLRAELERRNGQARRSLPTTRERMRTAPSFGGLVVSREDFEDRVAIALARVAGHLYFDALPEERQLAYRKLAQTVVLALDLVEHDLRQIAHAPNPNRL
jgi:hypothetical protein